jgi:hypothetical protein
MGKKGTIGGPNNYNGTNENYLDLVLIVDLK